MDLNDRNDDNKMYRQFRSSMDIGMGVMYIVISVYAAKMNFIIERYGKTMVYTLAGLFIFYGVFRIYRGIRKAGFFK